MQEQEWEKKEKKTLCNVCAFAVVGIIMCAHFSNGLNALVLHIVCTEAIVYHLRCGNYFINKTLAFLHKKRVFFVQIFFSWHDLMFGLPSNGSIAWYIECEVLYSQLIYRYTRISLTGTTFFSKFFSHFSIEFF